MRKSILLIALLLAILTLAAYAPIVRCGFVSYDDELYVTKNAHVRGGLSAESVGWAFTSTHAANYHPLTWLSHMADVEWGGLNAAVHHASGVVIHVLNALLLFGMLQEATQRLGRSAFVAGLFALHPLHVESVAWISERKDVLSTLFWMLSLWAYVRWTARSGFRRYVAVVVFFALGLMAKQMLVTLPLVLLLLDIWPLERTEPARKLVREKAPLFVLALAFGITVYVVQARAGAMASADALPSSARIANALSSYVIYAWKMIWPTGFAAFYPYPSGGPDAWRSAGAALLLMLASVGAVRVRRRFPYVALGWFWYLVTLLPVIGLVQVGLQARADRYTYVPLIGLFVIVAWGVPDLVSALPYRRAAMGTAAGLAIVLCGALTRRQAGFWKNDATLFRHALEVTQDNFVAHDALGKALDDRGDPEAAIDQFQAAVQINPRFVRAQSNLGAALAKSGRIAEAVPHIREALRLQPSYADAHNNLGIALAISGSVEDAAAQFSEAVRIDPDQADAHRNLGFLLERQGDTSGARLHYSEALRLRPESPAVREALARLR